MKKFYAVEYLSGRNTTTGQPNQKTGYLSIAVHPQSFSSKPERDAWVDDGEHTSDMRGNCRSAVTLRQLRGLHLGLSLDDFDRLVEAIQYAS